MHNVSSDFSNIHGIYVSVTTDLRHILHHTLFKKRISFLHKDIINMYIILWSGVTNEQTQQVILQKT